MNPPSWYSDEKTISRNLHSLIARLSYTPVSLTKYQLSDGFRHLADLEAPTAEIRDTAAVQAVVRTYEGAWRLRVACNRCGLLHVHGAGAALAPAFGERIPPCGGKPYHLRFDN